MTLRGSLCCPSPLLGAKPFMPVQFLPIPDTSEALMTLGFDASTLSSKLQVRKLQEQFEGLLSDRDLSHVGKGLDAPTTLLKQLPINVPLMVEAGVLIMRLLRRPSGSVKGEQASRRSSKAGRMRRGLVRPVLAVVATLGAAYAVSRVAFRLGGNAQQSARPFADTGSPPLKSRSRPRITY